MKHNHNLIWIDLEMTGLEPARDRIIEIATVVTDAQLNVLAEGPVFAIWQEPSMLATMDAWNVRQHNQSGLVKRVQEQGISEQIAESRTIEFLQKYVDSGHSPMCGNSICQDRRFLVRYMPSLAAFFHYRNLDVSTLKELAKRWKPEIMSGLTKESRHLALADIYDSIAELKYYRSHFLRLDETGE